MIFTFFFIDYYAAHTGIGLSEIRAAIALRALGADSEFDPALPAAGQMRLTALQKAQMKRQRDKCMAELKAVLERVRLALDEFNTAEAELEIPESPDLEYEAEEEKKRIRKKKLKRKRMRARRKLKQRKEQEKSNEIRQESITQESSVGSTKTSEEREKNADKEASAELDEESSCSSDEEEEEEEEEDSDEDEDEDSNEDEAAEEKEKKEESWTMPGQIERKVSRRMLVKVSSDTRYNTDICFKCSTTRRSSIPSR